MITTAALVTLIGSLGWLFLNWRSYRASAANAGWDRQRQLQMALVWVAIIASLSLIFGYFQP